MEVARQEDLRVADSMFVDVALPAERRRILRERIATALTAARAEQREVDARIVEAQADPNWNLHYRKIAAAIRVGKE